jgi:hypothetical protein
MYQEIKDRLTGVVASVKRLSDGACIPLKPGNKEYDEYVLWLAAGNMPLPDPEMAPGKIAERVAAEQAIADRRAEIIAKLSGLTDVQIDSHIDSNVTNLSGAVAYLKRLTKVVRVLALDAGIK